MAEVVLFHHAQGLTLGVAAFADSLRRYGHTVHTPDLFEGRTFDTLDGGMAHVEAVGFGEILERGVRAAEGLPAEVVYAGFSLGVLPAQKLAQTRAGARGALLCYSCVPVAEFSPAWPEGVPVQVHGMDADPIFVGEGDIDAARALVAEAAEAELFLYPGDQHYFADSSLPSYDPAATDLLTARVLGFLDRVKEVDEFGRPHPPIAADETATLLGFLDYQRATLAWKCGGVDAAGLSATVGVSAITLGGLLKHTARVEDIWFSQRLHGQDPQPLWANVDWGGEWTSAAEDSPERLVALWEAAVARSRTLVAEALADGGLEGLARIGWPNGGSPSLRWILAHMIEEYGRHNGHADLLREVVDGETGE